jgi:hypothetical protein
MPNSVATAQGVTRYTTLSKILEMLVKSKFTFWLLLPDVV